MPISTTHLLQNSAQITEWNQRNRLHAAATAGDMSTFDIEMRAVSSATHGPSLPPAAVLNGLQEDPQVRDKRLDREAANREMLLALVDAPLVSGLVHPLDSARANIAVSRLWPHHLHRTHADEKWMYEVMQYYARWPVMSAAPVSVLEGTVRGQGEGGDLVPIVQRRRDTLRAVGRGVIDKLSPGKKQ